MSNKRIPAKGQRNPIEDVQVRFERASAQLRESVQHHVEYSDSSADEEADDGSDTVKNVWQKRMKAELKKETANDDTSSADEEDKVLSEDSMSKSMYHIEQLRCSSCLVCLSSIKAKHAIWSCVQCYTIFHLPCIQKWAKDSTEQRTLSEDSPYLGQAAISVVKAEKIVWDCPKCRLSYKKEDIPQKNYCFCKKTVDPQSNWLLPHCCDSICEKPLQPACGHKCLLTCHPGPCPPCPRFIQKSCHCSRGGTRPVRCSSSAWQCDQSCGRLLACGQHLCAARCHEGPCLRCELVVQKSCACSTQDVTAECGAMEWHCDKVCNNLLICKFHKCTKTCHAAGDCEPCPLSGEASCPCGSDRSIVQCPDQVPLCGGTCNKELPCGEHRCGEKCHRGPCPPCPALVSKRCRCEAHTRSVPCSKEYVCETKCRKRPCGRHSCSRRCCVDCPPCGRPCSKPLPCGRHKCQADCHLGPCYPCPLQNKVSCRCGDTFFLVNCGQKNVKPPSCNKPCREKFVCSHQENPENAHKCHFGDCPPCKTVCEKALKDCDHLCKAQCHRLVKLVCNPIAAPATPVEVQTPKVKKVELECPPCGSPVPVACPGGHEVSALPCHRAASLPCGRPCGQPLPCGNHKCQKLCHLVPRPDRAGDPCESCDAPCVVPRPKHCKHWCPVGSCHPAPCPVCSVPTPVPCYCSLQTLYLRCNEMDDAPADKFSCGSRCVNNMACGHLCRRSCHLPPCDNGEDCKKRVKIYCVCKTNKSEAICHVVRSTKMTLPCNEICKEKKVSAEERKRQEELRKKRIREEKEQQELEEYNRKYNKTKKERTSFKPTEKGDKKNSTFHNVMLGVTLLFIVLGVAIVLIWPEAIFNE